MTMTPRSAAPADGSPGAQPTEDWANDRYLIGLARAALRRSILTKDWPMLAGYVQNLRSLGSPVDEVYAFLRARYPEAPPLDEIEALPET